MVVVSNENNNNGRQQRRRLSEEKADRLSSLPDAMITHILSFLPINSAAATSVLSHRWRHLWTGVTRLNIRKPLNFVDILPKLSSSKFHVFVVELHWRYRSQRPHVTDSCLREVLRRNVEHIKFHADINKGFFRVPGFLFNSKSLVILELVGIIEAEMQEHGDIHLPNLKKLKLCYLFNLPLWLGKLIRSSPLLEDLYLVFHQRKPNDENCFVLDIISPNLKLLHIEMHIFMKLTRRNKISIDAPKLEFLKLYDGTSFYRFLQNPTWLTKACIELVKESDSVTEDEDAIVCVGWKKDYLHQMFMFLGGMLHLRELDVGVDSRSNIFSGVKFENRHGVLPIFPNITRLTTSFCCIHFNGCHDLLHSLRCFPNLKHLESIIWMHCYHRHPFEQVNWFEPNDVPDCLMNKVETITLKGLNGIDNELKLLAYILGYSTNLTKLHLYVRIKGGCEQTRLLKERKFCLDLFTLPKSSSNCEVMVLGEFIIASSNDFRNDKLICKVHQYD